jgi:hypothetical protein
MNRKQDIINAIPSEIAVVKEIREEQYTPRFVSELSRICSIYNILGNKENASYYGGNPYILSGKLQEEKGFDIVAVNQKEIMLSIDVKERLDPRYQDTYMELYYNDLGELDFGYNQSDYFAFKLADGSTKYVKTWQVEELLKADLLSPYLRKQAKIHAKDGKDLCIPFGELEKMIERQGLNNPDSIPQECKYIDVYESREEIPVGIDFKRQVIHKVDYYKEPRM